MSKDGRQENLIYEENQLLRAILDQVGAYVFAKDLAGRYTYANRAVCDLFGKPPREIVGADDEALFDLSISRDLRINDLEVIEHGKPVEREERNIIARTGETRFYWAVKQPLRDAEGKIVGLCGVSSDITERKSAEAALAEAQARFRELFDQAPLGIWLMDPRGRIVECNPKFVAYAGSSREKLIGFNILDDAKDDSLTASLQAALRGERLSTETAYRSTTGNRSGYYRFHFQPLPMVGGEVGVLSFVEEISAWRQAEDRLKEREALLSKILDTSSVAIFLVDRSGIITHANQRMAEMFGTSLDRIIGTEYVAHIHPLEREAGRSRMLALLHSEIQTVELERLYWRQDGTEFWGLLTGRRFQDAEGQELGLVGVIADITARKQASERHSGVIEASMDGFFVLDPEGYVRECNAALGDLVAWSKAEILGRKLADLVSAEPPEKQRDRLTRVAREGRERFETRWRRKDGTVFDAEITATYLKVSGEICGYVRDVTLIKEHDRELQRIAHYDSLTGVPNRTLLTDRLNQALSLAKRSGHFLAVCYLDLDGFKPINDSYGHDAGDLILCETASRLKSCLRSCDTVARIGGDEFVLLLTELERSDQYRGALDRILEAVSRPVSVGKVDCVLSASIGVALYPKDDVDPDTLLRHADQAMYVAKQGGKNRFHLFDPDHDRLTRERTEHLARIEAALKDREFVLYYQPQVNMRSGRVLGAEALVRWQHPQRGLLPPADFLAVIEDTDLIVHLGDWVLATALGQLGEWRLQGLDLRISVNIAARHLLRSDFAERLRRHLARHPEVPPGNLDIEVLETAAIEDIRHVSGVIRECRQLGVTFSLDDFGTGYSSLSYLKRLPTHTLKIDRTFVCDMLNDQEDRAIVEGIIGLARVFGRSVIAEGVETTDHGTVLLDLGCDLAQGYGIARPMPPESLREWLAQWRPDPRWPRAKAPPGQDPAAPAYPPVTR